MKRVTIVEKSQLSCDQLSYINQRLDEPVHKDDAGPPKVWGVYQNFLYAVIRNEDEVPVGIVEASGRPVASPGWWIDSKYRKQGYGYELVEALAEYLVQDGVDKLGPISIQGNCEESSRKLAKRLRQKFSEMRKQMTKQTK